VDVTVLLHSKTNRRLFEGSVAIEAGKKSVKRHILLKNFVLHFLRCSCLTRLGESGTNAFTIMRLAGHSSVNASRHYVHLSPSPWSELLTD
jgi:site-specific recombinase XerD